MSPRTLVNVLQRRCLSFVWIISFFFGVPILSGTLSAAPPAVLTEAGVDKPSTLMQNWMMARANEQFLQWDKRFADLKTPAQIAGYQQERRKLFIEHLGGFPERTELNATVTGVVPRNGYRVEKVLYESQPGHFVTGLCFVPNSPDFTAPFPAVLMVCGHSHNGKALDAYQSAGALLALNGIVGFLIDPVCQGERYEHLKADGSVELADTTGGHTLLGSGSILLGQNVARNLIWDGMRGIDYLQQRDDVDGTKIGCMGNSGGGTQTSYLMALDDRIQAAAPSCYITSFEKLLTTIGPQDAEQNIYGQLNWGMDHADYLIMRAPIPILICTATEDFFSIAGAWESFRKAKRVYTRLGYSDRVDLIEADGGHGWQKALREASVKWMCRWLAGRNVDVREPALQLLTEQECQVTPKGQTLLLEGRKSAFDLNVAEFDRLHSRRTELWKNPADALHQVRAVVGVKPLSALPPVDAKKTGEHREGELTVEHWVFTVAEGIQLPAFLFRPESAQGAPVLFVHPSGKSGEIVVEGKTLSALSLAQSGRIVLAVDLRGTGETLPEKGTWYNKRFGQDGRHLAIAYLLGANYVGMRAEEIIQVSNWLLHHLTPSGGTSTLDVLGEGTTALSALHAVALEPELFAKVTVVHTVPSWRDIISSKYANDQFVNCIHGAAQVYDISHLVEFLGTRCDVLEPVNTTGVPLGK